MTNPQDLVAVLLPRQIAERVADNPVVWGLGYPAMISAAAKEALANPSVTVEGFVSYDKSYGRVTLVSDGNPDLTGWIELATVGKFTKAGITITPKGGQSGE